MTSSKFWPVSTCMTGNGTRAGQNALTARCSITTESLPPENSSPGRSIVAATSRKMCTASASSFSRSVSSYVVVMGAFPTSAWGWRAPTWHSARLAGLGLTNAPAPLSFQWNVF